MRLVLLAGMLLASSAHAAKIEVFSTVNDPQTTVPWDTVITLKGEISEYDYDWFWNAVKDIPSSKRVMVELDSPGGNVKAGMNIGLYIHYNKFMTMVMNGTVCTSMCASIWLAGERRFIEAGAYLGFHSTGIKGERSEQGNQILGDYYQKIGVRKDTADVLLSYDPMKIVWLTVEMSRVLGITYEVYKYDCSRLKHPERDCIDGGIIGRGYHWGEPPPPPDAMPMRPDRESVIKPKSAPIIKYPSRPQFDEPKPGCPYAHTGPPYDECVVYDGGSKIKSGK